MSELCHTWLLCCASLFFFYAGELIMDYAPTSGWLGGNAKTSAGAKEKLCLG